MRYFGPLRTVEGVPQNDVSHIRFRLRSFSYHNGLNEYMWSTAGVEWERDRDPLGSREHWLRGGR